MKYVIYYNRKAGNGLTYKHYYQMDGVFVMDAKHALKFDDKLNADRFCETLSPHWFIVEQYDPSLKTFKAQWFQYPTGRYLSADESFNNVTTCKARDIETAIEVFKERESADSELLFLDRVNVWELKD